MTNEKNQEKEKPLKDRLGYNHNYLELGASVAENYLKQGEAGIPIARKSLELLLKDIGFSDPWISKTVTDPSIVSKTIENMLDTYYKATKDETVSEIFDFYKEDFEKYLGGNSVAKDELKPYMDKDYSKILWEYEKAGHVIEGKEKYDLGSNEEVDSAKKTIEKYQKLIRTIGMIKSRKQSQFRNRVEDEVTKENFDKMYPKKEKEKK